MKRRSMTKLVAVLMLLVMAVSLMSQSVFAAQDVNSRLEGLGELSDRGAVLGGSQADTGWIALGGEGFSKGDAEYTSIALDNNNVPYVVYVDAKNDKKATVKKYTDKGWQTVGKEGFSPKKIKNTSIVFDKNNTPYVLYIEESSNKIAVSKLVKDKWTDVGYFVGYGDEAALAVDSKGTIYVAYTYSTKNILCGLSLGGIVVNKYVKGLWLPEFSLSSLVKNNLYSAPSIALDSRDNPYVAFNNNGINVMKASGFGWNSINLEGKPNKNNVKYVSLAIDKDGKPLVAFQDNKGKAVVSNTKNGYWEVSEGKAEYVSLTVSKDGTPYIAYVDQKNGNKAVVKKFEDNKWNSLGNGISKGKAKYTSIVADNNGGVYVAYQDDANKKKATVSKFTNQLVVKFETDGGTQIPDQYVPYNGKVIRPEDPVKEGYIFENWYVDSFFIEEYDFETPVKSNLTLYAKYSQEKTCNLTVNVVGNGSVEGWANGETKKFTLGDKVTLLAIPEDDSKLVYWKDEFGRVVSTDAEFTFDLGCPETFTAYFIEKSKYLVTFKNGNGEIIKSVYLLEGDDVEFPKAPALYGHKFIGWDKTAEEIKEAQEDVVVTALYEKLAQTVTVAVYGGSGSGVYNVKDYVTVVADEPKEGEKFAFWEDKAGNILSFTASYGFTVTRDIELFAVYQSEFDRDEAEATISITNVTVTDEKISFVAERVVPPGNSIITHGIIVTNDASIGESKTEFIIGKDGVLKASALTKGLIGVFVLNKVAEQNETWYARGYVIYKDSEGEVYTVYSDIVNATRE